MDAGFTAAPPPLFREAAALVYVADLEAPQVEPEDAHHLSAVLRLRPGELVVASDGAGGYRGCRVAKEAAGAGPGAAGGDRPRRRLDGAGPHRPPGLRPDTEIQRLEKTQPEVTVGFSLAKGERTAWAVAKLAELGVDRIVPMRCERTVTRWAPAAAGRELGRLRRIARESSMQARRVFLPEVLEPLSFPEAVAALGGAVALAEPGGGPLSLATPSVLVGPEGGFTDRELAAGREHVGLGGTILRVETAAVAAGAVLVGLRGGVLPALPADGARR